MIPTILLYTAIALGSLTETPFIAWDLATHMSRCDRIEWSKMRDDSDSVRFVITFHKMDLKTERVFEKTLSKHKCCKSEIK